MRLAATAAATMQRRIGVGMPVKFDSARSRRVARAAAAALVVALATLSSAAPAQAAAPDIEFSDDGISFTSTYSGSLFPAVSLIVPGDHQSSSFWVRNTTSSTAYLRVVLSDVVASGPEIADAITVQSSTPGYRGAEIPLSSAAPCWVLVEGTPVPSGRSVKVSTTVSLVDLRGKAGQNESATLSLGVGMSDFDVSGLPRTSCLGTSSVIPLGGPPIKLAMTGSETPYALIAASAGALGVGWFLLVAAKRRRREEE